MVGMELLSQSEYKTSREFSIFWYRKIILWSTTAIEPGL